MTKTKENKIAFCLWFDDQAEEAANFYVSLFDNAKIIETTPFQVETPSEKPIGSVMTVDFELEDFPFTALNGGPEFKFTPAISFFINCTSKEEVDDLWEKLSEGGKVLMPLNKYDFSEKYGWIQDKYGVSWQIIFTSPEGDWRPKIIPSFLFSKEQSGKTKEAIDFYTSVFHDSKVGMIAPNEKIGAEGAVAYADFMLENQWFAAMGSPETEHNFTFNEAISFEVSCETQDEVDEYWQKLSAVPESEQCGWLKDKYGVSWQIVPTILPKLLSDPNPKKSSRVMEALLQMKKLDIEGLKEAAK